MTEIQTAATTTHRTMNTVIHAAFRRDLRRLVDGLDRFPADSWDRADQLTDAWRNVAHQLRVHHWDEESLFWPAFVELGADRSLMEALEGEHERMVDALRTAEQAMEGFAMYPTATNAAAARCAIGELHRVLDVHLSHEERDLEPFGAAHKDTPQHKAAVAHARRSHTEGIGTFFAWLGDTDDPDIAVALRREVPALVLFLLTKIGGRHYTRRSTATWRGHERAGVSVGGCRTARRSA
jgi:hypothetical protein